MAVEKFGIENLQKVLAFGVTIGTQIVGDVKDKKLSFLEVLQLATQFTAISDFIANKDAIINEAKDLSLAEIEQLVKSVEGVINNAQVTAVIEHALDAITSIVALINDFKPTPIPPSL